MSEPHGTPLTSPTASTGMAEALLHEILDLLQRFVDTGEAGAVDLRGLPMTQGDREELALRLGEGEVRATIHVSGTSTVVETAYAGIWWLRHEAADGQLLAEQIVIARVPEILLSHPEDIALARERLAEALAAEAAEILKEKTHGS